MPPIVTYSETRRYRTIGACNANTLPRNGIQHIGNDIPQWRGRGDFVNMMSSSYLGLHSHPWIVQGTRTAIGAEQTLAPVLEELRTGLSDLYRARCVPVTSTPLAGSTVLPLIASGHLTDDGRERTLVVDSCSRVSIDRTRRHDARVYSCPHNDLERLEDMCKKHKRVAYVADGAYSLGGIAPVEELLELQDRYGLMLFFDDTHSLSTCGERGEGVVRSRIPGELNSLTIIVASLGKAFGAGGAVIMLGPERYHGRLRRYGGPLAWSDPKYASTIGACLGALRVHNSPELARRQRQMHYNAAVFDNLVSTPQAGTTTPIRVIDTGTDAKAISLSRELLVRGYYTSPVMSPDTAAGEAGVRIRLRADHIPHDIRRFCAIVNELLDREPPDSYRASA